MHLLSMDLASVDDRRRAKMDAEAARRALLRLADLLGTASLAGEPGPAIVPADLALWAADAIRTAMAKPPSRRAKALTDGLGITARRRRKSADVIDVGGFIVERLLNAITLTRAKGDAANHFKIDERTVGRYWSVYRGAIQESQASE